MKTYQFTSNMGGNNTARLRLLINSVPHDYMPFGDDVEISIDTGSTLTATLPIKIENDTITNNSVGVVCSGASAWAEGLGDIGMPLMIIAAPANNDTIITVSSTLYAGVGGRVYINDVEYTIVDVDSDNNTIELDNPVTCDAGTPAEIKGGAYAASAHSEGTSTQATDQCAHSEGTLTIASGTAAHAEGLSTKAIESYAHAEGLMTNATASSAHAEGANTIANGYASHAEGDITAATVSSAHAEGNNTLANGYASHAEGHNTIANSQWSHAEGHNTATMGDKSHAEGDGTIAYGMSSHVEGQYGRARGPYSHVEGDQGTSWRTTTTAAVTNDNQVPVGSIDGLWPGLTVSIDDSDYEIVSTNAVASSITLDQTITCDAYTQIAVLTGTTDSAGASHVEGAECLTKTTASHAEGYRTAAVGYYSHTEGLNSVASGYASHAGGDNCQASGYAAHALGWGTYVSQSGGCAVGRYNSDHEALFSVGIGTDLTARLDAFKVDQYGKVWFTDSNGVLKDLAALLASHNIT